MKLGRVPIGRRVLPPALVDGLVVAATGAAVTIAIAARQESSAKDPDALAYLLGSALALVLAVRRRFPLVVFLASVVLVMGYHALDYPAIGLAAPLAASIYTAARAGFVRPVLVVMVGLELWGLGWRAVGEHESLLSTLGTATVAEVLVVAVLLLLAEGRRTRERWASEVAERRVAQERIRIAHELHDVLAHTIAVIGVQAGVAEEAVADSPDEARTALRAIRERSRDAMGELRAAVGALREHDAAAPRGPAPGLARLDELLEAARAELRVGVSVDGAPRPLPAAVDLVAYRVVQESLTNVLRHAGAREVSVAIRYDPDGVALDVVDDGRGAAGASANGAAHGLAGMRERVAAIGGRLDAGPARREGGGFRVSAWLPAPAATS